jgi:hypothetical protein
LDVVQQSSVPIPNDVAYWHRLFPLDEHYDDGEIECGRDIS